MRRTRTLMYRRHVSSISTIAVIVVALLASGAGLAMAFAREGHAASAIFASPASDRSVDRAQGQPFEPDGSSRVALLRSSAPAVTRVHVSSSPTDGVRGSAALGAESPAPALATVRRPGDVVEARQHGVASPGQPAPASRAPPIP